MPGVSEISLHTENLREDIDDFVRAKVHDLAERKQFLPSIESDIQNFLMEGADGMFLWVSLVLQELSKSDTINELRGKLKALPTTLSDVYQKILNTINPKYALTARKALQCIVYAARPMTLNELKVAISVTPQHTSISSLQEDVPMEIKGFLIQIFGPLIKLHDDESVHLVHQSAKDFLTDEGREFLSVSNTPISLQEAHIQLAVACLLYLLFDDFKESDAGRYQSFPEKYTFLDYAAMYWVYHTRLAALKDQRDNLWPLFQELVQSGLKLDLAYQLLLCSQAETYEHTPPLQVAAHLGLAEFVFQLLQHGAEVNEIGGKYRNALHAGLLSSNEAVDRLLLESAAAAVPDRVMMKLLLDAATPHSYSQEQLHSQYGRSSRVTASWSMVQLQVDPIVAAAVGNWQNSREILEQLFSWNNHIEVSNAVLLAAVANEESGK
ncbi:hypothetical protein BDD12DRAFT_904904 [Trichophaea hybrida]|nr:hypothetical protein BDD12DRAFT_904904 [Trichophaea hybrida]